MTGLFRERKKENGHLYKGWSITRDCLRLILEASRSSHPNEFAGFLRVDDEEKYLISEVVLIPGTISGEAHAIFRLHMLPIDYSIVGTIHSHPLPDPRPSEEDLSLFRMYGKVHIISAYPYSEDAWRGYDYNGRVLDIKIV